MHISHTSISNGIYSLEITLFANDIHVHVPCKASVHRKIQSNYGSCKHQKNCDQPCVSDNAGVDKIFFFSKAGLGSDVWRCNPNHFNEFKF